MRCSKTKPLTPGRGQPREELRVELSRLGGAQSRAKAPRALYRREPASQGCFGKKAWRWVTRVRSGQGLLPEHAQCGLMRRKIAWVLP